MRKCHSIWHLNLILLRLIKCGVNLRIFLIYAVNDIKFNDFFFYFLFSKIVELEEELRVVGNNLKSLEVSEEKVKNQRLLLLKSSSLITGSIQNICQVVEISYIYFFSSKKNIFYYKNDMKLF